MAKKREKKIIPKQSDLKKERRYLNILTRGYVIFVLAVMPLVVGTEGYDDIIFSKAQVYWSVTLVFLFAFMLFYLAHRLGQGRNPDGVKWYKKTNVADWALVVFFVVITISSILSPYQSFTWLGTRDRSDGWLTMFCMLACYYPISRWYKPSQLDFSLYAISSSIFCIIGYLQFYGYDFMNLFPYGRSSFADNEGNPLFSGFTIPFRSTIGNIDFVSAYVCIAVVAFGVLYIKTKGPRRFLYLTASVMNVIMMFIGDADAGKVGVLGAAILIVSYLVSEKESAARALILGACSALSYVFHHWFMINIIMPGWGDAAPAYDLSMRSNYSTLPLKPILALSVVCLAAGILILSIKKWPKPKTARFAGLAVIIVIIASGIGCVEAMGKNLPQDNVIYQAREILHGNAEDYYASNRIYIWRNALNAVPDQPLFGTGQDTFLYALGEDIQNDALKQYGIYIDKAHNDFIQILLCNGVFGLAAYIALMISLIAFSIKPALDDSILLMSFMAVLAYLGQSMFGVDSITVTPIFWLMIAITRNRQLAAAGSENHCF